MVSMNQLFNQKPISVFNNGSHDESSRQSFQMQPQPIPLMNVSSSQEFNEGYIPIRNEGQYTERIGTNVLQSESASPYAQAITSRRQAITSLQHACHGVSRFRQPGYGTDIDARTANHGTSESPVGIRHPRSAMTCIH